MSSLIYIIYLSRVFAFLSSVKAHVNQNNFSTLTDDFGYASMLYTNTQYLLLRHNCSAMSSFILTVYDQPHNFLDLP